MSKAAKQAIAKHNNSNAVKRAKRKKGGSRKANSNRHGVLSKANGYRP